MQTLKPVVLAALVCAGCSKSPASTDVGGISDVRASDTDVLDADVPDVRTVRDGSTNVDAGSDTAPAELIELVVHDPAMPPVDMLAGSGLESCEVYQATACTAGMRQVCDVYDTAGDQFVDPDPLLRRTLLYDRWYDLYHQPQGQTAERVFNRAMPAGTPESEWGDVTAFAAYTGLADAAIWNGAALVAATMRYLATGTDADYQRMERKTRDLLLQFDVTGIPGYLARHHYLVVPPGTPARDDVVLVSSNVTLDHRHLPFDPTTVPDIGPLYTGGLLDGDGQPIPATAMFNGQPSIDQYTGPRIGFGLVFNLLRDEGLKARIVEHLTCYLKRLQRIEIQNLQDNPDALATISQYVAGSGDGLLLDDDDIDLLSTDTIVMYVTPNLNSLNVDTYDRSCPATVPRDVTRVIDAAADDFAIEILKLVTDLNAPEREKVSSLDHVYAVTIRGADAMHMMHIAATAYYMTGEEQYREFLQEDLVRDLDAIGVAHTAGAFAVPVFCRKFFGHHIAFSPAWAFLELLDESELKTQMQHMFETEMWQKEMRGQANAKFNIMYGATVPPGIASAAPLAVVTALQALEDVGGNGGVVDDPRRLYSIDPAQLLADVASDGISLRCPTADEVAFCEQDINAFGLSIPGGDITSECVGRADECSVGTECAVGVTDNPLPPSRQAYGDFRWQRSPFKIGLPTPIEGRLQSPGLDLTEEYWLARYYDFITTGKGQVLAWRDDGPCPGP